MTYIAARSVGTPWITASSLSNCAPNVSDVGVRLAGPMFSQNAPPLDHCRSGADQGSSAAQPIRRVTAVVGVLRRFDAVEESLVDQCLSSSRDRPEQDRGVLWIGPRREAAPQAKPVFAHRVECAARDPVEEGRLVQQRMAHSAVTPVQQGECASVAAEVPRVKIAVDERVLQAAGNHFGKPPRKIAQSRKDRPTIGYHRGPTTQASFRAK